MNDSVNDANTAVRPFNCSDEAAVITVWHRSGRAAYQFLPTWQAFTLERAGEIFREVIRPRCNIWVGTRNGQVVAFLAMAGSYIDRMFVDPAEWRRGWGRRLVLLAKTLHPDGLELHTHQQNHAARQLYERHGFKAVRFGVSPPPESAPDVEYHWRPAHVGQTERNERSRILRRSRSTARRTRGAAMTLSRGEIRTDRLLLRRWRPTDLAPFAALNADARVMEYFPETLSREESDALASRIESHFEQHGFGLWAVEIPNITPFAGFIGLSVPRFEAPFMPCVEIGWRLAAQHWRLGYATEGARAAMGFGFEVLGLDQIVSFTTAANLPSRRVMEKIGMLHDAADDFDHPHTPDGHRLRHHVLYRRSRPMPNSGVQRTGCARR